MVGTLGCGLGCGGCSVVRRGDPLLLPLCGSSLPLINWLEAMVGSQLSSLPSASRIYRNLGDSNTKRTRIKIADRSFKAIRANCVNAMKIRVFPWKLKPGFINRVLVAVIFEASKCL